MIRFKLLLLGLILIGHYLHAQDHHTDPTRENIIYKFALAKKERNAWLNNGPAFRADSSHSICEWQSPDSLHVDHLYGYGLFYYTLNKNGKVNSVKLLTLELYVRGADRIFDWLVFTGQSPSGNRLFGIGIDSIDTYIFNSDSKAIAEFILGGQMKSNITFKKVDFSQAEPYFRNIKRKNEFFLPFYFNTTKKKYEERSEKYLQEFLKNREKRKSLSGTK